MFKVHVKGETPEELKSNLQALINQMSSSTSLPKAVKNTKTAPVVDEEDDEEETTASRAQKKLAAKKPVQADEDEDEDEDPADDDEDGITHDTVKKLAQKKIAAGDIDRAAVKKHVTKLGGNQISDLDSKALTKLHGILEAA